MWFGFGRTVFSLGLGIRTTDATALQSAKSMLLCPGRGDLLQRAKSANSLVCLTRTVRTRFGVKRVELADATARVLAGIARKTCPLKCPRQESGILEWPANLPGR